MPSKVFDKLQLVELSDEDMNQPCPLGPVETLKTGVLPNGIRYYVRPHTKPEKRIALALVVKIGSVVEEEHERGLAHIVEHLAFNATEKFSGHEIVKFLEKIGAQFGADQNAYTSADETCYQLVVPSDTPQLLADALSVMAQFAFHIRAAPGDLTKERGAVLEEWRMSRDATGRSQEAHWQLIMQGSRYAERLPIGTEDVIKNAPAERVRAFYERWYRPENMAVVAVGDFPDAGKVVEQVASAFGQGHSRDTSPPPQLPTFDFAPHTTPRYKVFIDKEVQESTVFVSFKQKRPPLSTPKQLLEHFESFIFQEILNTRFFKLSREQDPPFAAALVSEEPLCATTQSQVLTAVALEGKEQVLHALETLLVEVARIRLHGVSNKQLAPALADLKADIESTYKERDQSFCWDVRDEYIRNFLHFELVTGQEYETRLSKTLLTKFGVNKERVQAKAQAFKASDSCVVKVVGHRPSITEADLVAVVKRVEEMEAKGEIGPWQGDLEVPDRLIEKEPEAPQGAIVSERHLKNLDATEIRLVNGMRVLMKHTTHMEDELYLTGLAAGGLTEVPQDKFYTASAAGVIAGQLGVYGYKPAVLNDFLAGKIVQLDLSEGAYSRSFKGVQSPADLEIALQLVHLLFKTQVKVDEAELNVVMKLLKQSVDAQQRNPLHHYHTRVRTVNYGGCYYFKPITLEDVDRVDVYEACNIHNQNYQNPAEFTVVLTGNMAREELQPLIEKYLASIPAVPEPKPKPTTELAALPWSFPKESVVEDFKVDMVSPITQTQVTFPVTVQRPRAREDLVWLKLLCQILETRLLQRMRFQFGEIYTVGVSPFFGCEAPSNPGDARGDVSIAFTCDPVNRHKLTDMALEEIDRLQAEGPSSEEVSTVVNFERLQWEESQQENGFWHDSMVMGFQSKTFQEAQDVDQVFSLNRDAREKVLASASQETVRDAMQRMFPLPCRSLYTAIAMVPKRPSLLRSAATAITSGLSSAVSSSWSALTGGGRDASTLQGSDTGPASLQHTLPHHTPHHLGGAHSCCSPVTTSTGVAGHARQHQRTATAIGVTAAAAAAAAVLVAFKRNRT